MTLKTAVFCALCLWILPGWSQSRLDIRLDIAGADPVSRVLFVDLSVRYQGLGQVVLGDQNYRLFYDTQNLTFRRKGDGLLLPDALYSPLHFHESLTNVKAGSKGSLPYDHDLGFLNIGTDLLSDIRGGIMLKKEDGWVRVVRLSFDVEDISQPCRIDWSREAKTASYASAFVELTQWEGPNKARPFILDEVYDLDYTMRPGVEDLSFAIGPNPTSEHVRIQTDRYLDEELFIQVTDAGGKTVIKTKKKRGTRDLNLVVGSWPAASYKLEIYNDQYQKVFHESIVVLR